MSTSRSETKQETGRTPSMAASLLVLAVMIGLILLSVVLFGEEVAEGPLQVSMTLAILYAMSVAYRYNFRGSLISDAISGGVNGSIGTVFVLIAIGTLYLSGSVAAFVYYGVAIVSPHLFYVIVFLLAALLSTLTSIGLNFATADPFSSIMLTPQMFRSQYAEKRLKPVVLGTSISDSGTIFSHVIPWNIDGAFYAGTLGVAAWQFAPYTFFAYLTPIVTFLMVRAYYLHKDQMSSDKDAAQVYGAEPTDLPLVKDLA